MASTPQGQTCPEDTFNPATFHGIHEWHKHMFEKFGWMMLSVNKGNKNPEKVTSYIKGVNLLECAIRDKLQGDNSTITEQKDLNILLNNVNILKRMTEQLKSAQPTQLGGKKSKKMSKKGSKKGSKK